MTYSEDDLLPISALQHLLFCERQCALIHVEHAWAENRFTAEGRILHERVHEQDSESRGDVRLSRGLRKEVPGMLSLRAMHAENSRRPEIGDALSEISDV